MSKSKWLRSFSRKPKSKLMLTTIIVLASVVMMPSVTLCGTTENAQEETTQLDPLGFAAPVDSVGVLLGINNRLRRENDVLKATVVYNEDMLGITRKPWYVEAYRSEPVRWIIFVLGVWLGTYASK